MHLGDGGCGDRRTKACERLRQGTFERGRDHGLGFVLRKGRQAVLQALQVARQHHANHIGPGGEELAELQIGRAHPLQRARQPRAGFGAAPLDQPRDRERKLRRRRHERRIDNTEDTFACEHKAGAGQPRNVG
jgi:hypothetical protein